MTVRFACSGASQIKRNAPLLIDGLPSAFYASQSSKQ
jgi:hypothetical protein